MALRCFHQRQGRLSLTGFTFAFQPSRRAAALARVGITAATSPARGDFIGHRATLAQMRTILCLCSLAVPRLMACQPVGCCKKVTAARCPSADSSHGWSLLPVPSWRRVVVLPNTPGARRLFASSHLNHIRHEIVGQAAGPPQSKPDGCLHRGLKIHAADAQGGSDTRHRPGSLINLLRP